MTTADARSKPPSARAPIVYGADWCEDTSRARRLLRRLSIAHEYHNVDEDVFALERACALNAGQRRTPVIDVGGSVLVEPANGDLIIALVRAELITEEEVRDRATVQNVGDIERAARTTAGLLVVAGAQLTPRLLRWPLRAVGLALAVTGICGWSPAYAWAGVTSIDGPADRPEEASRSTWFAPTHEGAR
ncbi:MAG TPA: YgaP-like transmembrane domain [Vicinamibacterales bacterium]|nr:YgaP-like transmembrane domain [Vicinamibacterales bacterium]